MKLRRLQADVSGVAKQSSKESKESYQLYLAIQEEQQIILRMTKYAAEIQDMQNRFKSRSIITFRKILEIFWNTHDPTTLNRQGNDVGTEYRSAIFFHNQKQRETAEKLKVDLNNERIYAKPIITEISPLRNFYAAEEYHRNYYEDHKNTPYCNIVINPKITSLLRKYKDNVKV